MTPAYIVIGVVVLLVLFVIGMYNGLVKGRLHAEEAFAGMDVQLKRRYDMVPNLVEITKKAAAHEQKVFDKLTAARESAMNAKGVQAKAQAENALSEVFKTIFALQESTPELKANETFMKLQDEYAILEDAIQGARRMYNSAVKSFNIKIETFPSNMVAGMFGFTKKEFFEIDNATERQNVEVKL